MSEQTTNPSEGGESSLSLDAAAAAIANLGKPKESTDQPEAKESENVVTEGSTEEAPEAKVEESQDQPEAEVEGETDEDEFLFGEEKVKASQLKEWREAGLRHEDYTRKTQELAQQRKEFEDWKAKEEQTFRTQWNERLAAFADVVVDKLKPFESIDWDKLRTEDRYEYNVKWTDFQRAQIEARRAQENIQRSLQEEEARSKQAREQMLQVEANEAKKRLPDLADPVKAAAMMGKMAAYLKEKGYSPAEMKNISAAKDLDVIHDAMRYRDIVEGSKSVKDKRVVAVSKVVKPGTARSNKEVRSERSQKREQSLHNRLRSSGNLQDAAALLRERMR